MEGTSKPPKRAYDASGRRAAAAQRRLALVSAARDLFEERGWAGTRLEDVSRVAGVSQKTVEALFGTKSALLRAAVDYAIRGDIEPLPMPGREAIAEMEGAPDAATMLSLHARHLRTVNVRSARIASVVEHAAAADRAVAKLWQTMNHNRAYAVDWATQTLLGKRGRRRGLTPDTIRPIFSVALDWGTYRTLSELAGLDADGYEQWLRDYYRALLLPPTAPKL
jgi:AcrR family transcriptional regulator